MGTELSFYGFSVFGLRVISVLVNDIPMCALAPFSQMIAYPAVRNEKRIAQRESHVTKKVLVVRYLYVVRDCIPP